MCEYITIFTGSIRSMLIHGYIRNPNKTCLHPSPLCAAAVSILFCLLWLWAASSQDSTIFCNLLFLFVYQGQLKHVLPCYQSLMVKETLQRLAENFAQESKQKEEQSKKWNQNFLTTFLKVKIMTFLLAMKQGVHFFFSCL